MLDNKTKKNIDDCKNILVGIVPNPISQVEQITIALIYKFMDDMDKESVEKFKGKPKFFTGKFAKYGWSKLFDPGLGGQEMLALYSEALEKMSLNPDIPELFRNIFKNAYLPYRNPATLKLFLKHISEFHYSHSEKLGDAFEYLLSSLGSQGDAGMFRTPRHIIEFITACVAPQKNETVLDPACGTAGFLLSAYKYILAHNTEHTSGAVKPGNKLKPDERKKLAGNFAGYDISPDMVRLSLVNMYLHGFTTPRIYEYDTLSSEDRWQETYDVILANPPFMTPKGGIRPHKKFGVQANKAEVLFTDYIAEHLNTNGRAGIVVPNGIVATSQTAYKQLRRMLVQESLIAVVSLPAGVFQPYAGVKTSVLLLDKKLAKKSSHILFLKVENDGFDLGAQRREIEKNDLPEALNIFTAYKEHLVNEKPFTATHTMATLVEKERVLENKDVILSAERYYELNVYSSKDYRFVELEGLMEFVRGVTYSKEDEVSEDGIKILRANNITIDNRLELSDIRLISKKAKVKEQQKLLKNDILICTASGSAEHIGKVAFIENDLDCYFGGFMGVVRVIEGILPRYLFECLKTEYFRAHLSNQISHTNIRNLKVDFINEFNIPLPPLEIQQQIVDEIEGYQKIIDGAKQMVNNYKPTIKINPEWEMVELGEVCEIVRGSSPRPQGDPKYFGGPVPRLMVADVTRDGMYVTPTIDSLTTEGAKKSRPMKKGEVVMAVSGNPGLPSILAVDACIHDGFVGYRNLSTKVLPEFLYFILLKNREENKAKSNGAVFLNLTTDQIKGFLIPIPDTKEQRQIVQEVKKEIDLINGNNHLIKIFEQKIKDKINEVWGVKE